MDTHIWRPSYESDFEVEIYDNSVVGEEDEHEDEWSLDVYREHDGTQEDDFAEKITMTTDLITQGLEDHQQQGESPSLSSHITVAEHASTLFICQSMCTLTQKASHGLGCQ